MKKFLVVFGLVLVCALAQAQVRFDLMLGGSSTYSKVDKDHVGSYCLGVSVNKLYVDINTNFVNENSVGNLPENISDDLRLSTYEVVKTNTEAMRVSGFNIGYVVFKKDFSIIPVLGYYQFDKITQDPLMYADPQVTTIKNYDSAVNVGCNFRYVNNHFGVMAGLGLVDRFKFTLVFSL